MLFSGGRWLPNGHAAVVEHDPSGRDRGGTKSLRVAAGGFALVVGLIGCTAELPPGLTPSAPGPPRIEFLGWAGPGGGNYTGKLLNVGETAHNIRVEVWYANAQDESVRVVIPGPSDVEPYHYSFFSIPAQISNGELRYPRLGSISWDGGSRPAEPRKTSILPYGACRLRADTLLVYFGNTTWAYHGSVTYEDRAGIHVVPIVPDPLPSGGWILSSLPLDSSGVQLPPRLLKVRWEDYGGVPDSVMDAPTAWQAGCN
jgi:hypothetical protein